MKKIIHMLCLALFITLMLTPEVQAQRRRGWSPQAKGAAIGTGAGAAAGAIINKRNRVVGGVIGGLAGGAAGYAIGKHKDNKNKAAARRAAEQREAERRAELARAEAEKVTPVASTNQVASATHRPNGLHTLAANPAINPVNALFLPNETVGDPTAPYASSEYRRKSW